MALLAVRHVTKRFGAKTVLADLSFSVPEGAIYGLVGVNGAGKTTTMKLILGLEQATAGEISIAGQPVRFGQPAVQHGVGYLPDVPQFYDDLSAREYLALCGRLTHTPNLSARIGEMLRLVALPDVKRRIHGYSRGMRQRLGIAQALLNRPRLLIADEPTSALDPAGRSEFLALLASLRGATTVLISTHILSDVERVCDQVGILHQGRMALSGPLAALLTAHQAPQLTFTFTTEAAAAAAAALLAGQQTGLTVRVPGGSEAAMAQALTRLLEAGLVPATAGHAAAHLESLFLEVTR